jgi:hypothetical protein
MVAHVAPLEAVQAQLLPFVVTEISPLPPTGP